MSELKCKVCGKTLTGKQKMFCSVNCRNKAHRENHKAERVCQVCGKPLPPRKQKVCSDECLKEWNKRYNSQYVAKRRAEDEEFSAKSTRWGQMSSQKSYAKRTWENRMEHAGVILKLAEMDNAQSLIAKYLDENFLGRGDRQRREFATDEEIKAGEILESLGDISSK